jgi:hypothetical protein
MIEVIIEIELVRPYCSSLVSLFDTANTWRMKVLESSSNARKALLSVPWQSFRAIWGGNPRKGAIIVPKGTGAFLKACKISEVRGK